MFLVDKGIVASHIITFPRPVDMANHIISILLEVLGSLKRIRFKEGQSYFYFTSNQGYHGIKLITLLGEQFLEYKKVYWRVNETDFCDWQEVQAFCVLLCLLWNVKQVGFFLKENILFRTFSHESHLWQTVIFWYITTCLPSFYIQKRQAMF